MNLKVCLTIACCAFSASSIAQKGKDVFQISIYSPPPPKFMNDEQYRTMKEAHIDVLFNVGQYTEANKEGNLRTLDMAAKHGLRVYIHDARLSRDDEQLRAMVADYKGHKALAGYYITDEPDSARLNSAVTLMNKVKALDPERDSYINHLPDWAVKDYEHGFLKRYIEGAKGGLNYLAYDNYPYKRKQRLEQTYFNNLEIIRRTGLKYGIKTSSCLQSFGMYFSGVEELRRPNRDEMRMNVYSNLAYGVKNPVWYPYWTQDNFKNPTLSLCIIDSAGRKTDLYEPFKQYNGEMQQLGKTLINLDAAEVYHTGDSLWIGTALPPAGFVMQVTDPHAELILSRFVHKTNGKEYAMIVNRSFRRPVKFTVRLKDSVKQVKEISAQNGKPKSAPFDKQSHTLTAEFLPGEGRLYALN